MDSNGDPILYDTNKNVHSQVFGHMLKVLDQTESLDLLMVQD